MKKIPRFLSRFFSPAYMQELDLAELVKSFNDTQTRNEWLSEVFEELRHLNLSVEQALLKGDLQLTALSARRKAFSDILEMVKTAQARRHENKGHDHNILTEVDLDRVTV